MNAVATARTSLLGFSGEHSSPGSNVGHEATLTDVLAAAMFNASTTLLDAAAYGSRFYHKFLVTAAERVHYLMAQFLTFRGMLQEWLQTYGFLRVLRLDAEGTLLKVAGTVGVCGTWYKNKKESFKAVAQGLIVEDCPRGVILEEQRCEIT